MDYKPIRPPNRIYGYANKMKKDPTKYEQMMYFALSYIRENDEYAKKFLSVIKPQFCLFDRVKNRWYIVDFYIAELRLVIEVDGKHHLTDKKQIKRDMERTIFLESIGLSVERVANSFITSQKFSAVLKEIVYEHINKQENNYYIINTSWRMERRFKRKLKKKIKKFRRKNK